MTNNAGINSLPLCTVLLVVADQILERIRLQTGATNKGTINIGHGHQASNIVRLNATSIQYPDRFGKVIA